MLSSVKQPFNSSPQNNLLRLTSVCSPPHLVVCVVGLYLLPSPGLVSPLGLGPALGQGLEAGLEATHPVLRPAPPVPGAVQELSHLPNLGSQLGTSLTTKQK